MVFPWVVDLNSLACDLIVASTNAKFALPEPKVGLAALAGVCKDFQDKLE